MSAYPSPAPAKPQSRSDAVPVRRVRRRVSWLLMCVFVAVAMLATMQSPVQGAAVDTTIERLAGLTRYDTAVAIADAYLEERSGSVAPVEAAVLTSGLDTDFGYAVVSPALSRLHNAPLLLTQPDELPQSVAAFLRTNGIRIVYILGGTDVVSADVEQSVDAIRGVSAIRIAGDDAYSTSVAVARRVGPRPGEPGALRSSGSTALVATGEVFADALAAGPLAYRGEHPVLLTRSDSLHADVASFLERSTDHVVIFGGPAAVSADVENAIESLGITTERLWGADRFATAVRVAEELLDDDPPHSCFDGGQLGLAFGRKAADAIVSGPLLGELCAPLLLSEKATLPQVVRSFLESNRYETGDADGDLRLTVFGGPLAVSSNAVSQAVAAGTLDPVRARISALEGRCHITVTFNEPVLTADAANVRYYRLAGDTLDPRDADVDAGDATTTTRATILLAGATQPTEAAVPVGCPDEVALRAREELEIVGGVIGTVDGRRTVRRSSGTVLRDRSRPRLTVTALDGADVVWVESNEPLKLGTGIFEFRRRGALQETAEEEVQVTSGALRFEVPVPAAFGGSLETGDRVTVDEGAVRDLVGHENREITVSARRDTTAPRISRVTVTEPQGRRAASIGINGRALRTFLRDGLTVTAKQGGEAFGAIGNDWTLRLDVELAWASNRASEVNVVTAGRRIELQVAHSRSLDDLADDLNRDAEFTTLFVAESDDDDGDIAVVDEEFTATTLDGGLSTVDMTVEWTEPVVDCNPGELEIDIDGDGDYDFYLDGYNIAGWGVRFVDAPEGNPAIVEGGADCDLSPFAGEGTLVARIESDDHSALPSLRSRLFTHVGAATDRAGNQSVSRRFSSFTRP